MSPLRSRRSVRVILSSFSAIAASAFLTFASPALAEQTDQLTYSVNAGEVTITGCNGDCPSDLVIRDMIDGKPVVAIADGAFANQEAITSATIPEGVTSIGENAFAGANGLTSVTIPSTVTSLGRAAFQSMNSLTTATFAAGSQVSEIPNDLFRSDPNLKNVVLPATVTSVGGAAFLEDGSLGSLTFYGNAPTVGENAFLSTGGAIAQLSSKSLTGYGVNGDDFYGLTVAGGIDGTAPAAPSSFVATADLGSNPATTTVTFSLAEAGGTVECRFNDSDWVACTSVVGTAGTFTVSTPTTLAAQTVSVRQTDESGNTSAVGTGYLNLLAPTLIGAPAGLGTTTGVEFQLSRASNSVLWCEFAMSDGMTNFRPCSNFQGWFLTYLGIKITPGEPKDGVTTDTITACSPKCTNDGSNTIRFKQVIDGKASPVSEATWTQDTQGPNSPELSGAPSEFTNFRSASISFSPTEQNSTFECSVDDGSYTACTSPRSLSGLSDGPHSLAVRGIDSLGNVGYENRASWTVDSDAPTAPIVSSPANSSTSTVTTVPFAAAGEDGAKLLCSLDGGAFVKCPRAHGAPGDNSTLDVGWNTRLHWGESADWSRLKWGFYFGAYYTAWFGEQARADNTYGVTLAAIWLAFPGHDFYGGPSCEAAHSTLAAYEAKLIVAVPDGNSAPTVYNTFNEDCSDASTEEVPPASPAQFTALSEGSHTLAVKQIDKAGNESVAATTQWTVALPKPPVAAVSYPSAPSWYMKGHSGHFQIKAPVSTGGDARGAAQPMTIQISTVAHPDPLLPARASNNWKVLKYSDSFVWNHNYRMRPLWIRVGTKAGKWTAWTKVVRRTQP